MLLPTLFLPVIAFAIAAPACAILIRLGRRVGALDSPGSAGHHKAELRPVPNIGGVAIFLATAGPLLIGALVLRFADPAWLLDLAPGLEGLLPRLREGSDGRPASTTIAVGLVAAMAVLHGLGLVDDRRGLPATFKLLVQLAVAAIVAIFFDVRLLTLLGPIPSIIITTLWIVVVTNAINFLDNMDGLAAGVAAIASLLFGVAAIVNHQWFIAAGLALLLGALVGFLIFNFPPAKIFMGDGGSLIVGFLLAVLTARTTYYDPSPDFALGSAWYAVFMPVIILAVPLYDFTSVTLIRLMQGKSPFVGDQQHFSHRLVQRGLSKRSAVVVIWSIAFVIGVGGISLGRLLPWQAALVGVQTVLMLLVIALLEHASRRGANP